MCGIAGILSDSIDLRQQNDMVWRVSNSLKMRGPDAHGEYISRNAALIHRRLSVIDPENGKQPMRFGKYIIVYNGEIYNTDEIRRELRFHGYVFELLFFLFRPYTLQFWVLLKSDMMVILRQKFVPLFMPPNDSHTSLNFGRQTPEPTYSQCTMNWFDFFRFNTKSPS